MSNISVIIPTNFRSINYLDRAVKSALNQTYDRNRFEVVIVNNAKKDLTFLNDRYGTDARITIIDASSVPTASFARNAGVDAAAFDYLTFLDDDDWFEPDYLQKMSDKLLEDRVDMVVCSYWLYKGENNTVHGKLLHADVTIEDMFRYNPGFTGSNFLITKAFFQKMGRWDEKLYSSNDKDFMIRFLQNNGRLSVTEDHLCTKDKTEITRISNVSDQKIDGTQRFIEKYRSVMSRRAYRLNMFKFELYKILHRNKKVLVGLGRLFLKYPSHYRQLIPYIKIAIRGNNHYWRV